MGNYLFGKSMSTYDCLVISAITFNYGTGIITGLEAVGLVIGGGILSIVFTNLFAKKS
jgi:hypothetical protein